VKPVKDAKKSIMLAENQGHNKYFPGGPTCYFRGKDIPCMFFISPSGGISGDILVKILKNLDKQHQFPHMGSPR